LIVLLASYPRSGNTYLRHIIETVYGYPTNAVYQGDVITGITSCGEPWSDYVKRPGVKFAKLHESAHVADAVDWTEPTSAIYLIRDGRDALVSQAHYELRHGADHNAGRTTFDEMLQAVIVGDISICPIRRQLYHWGHNVLSWLGRTPPAVVVRFEDLIGPHGREVIVQVLDMVGVGNGQMPNEEKWQQARSFEKMQQLNPVMFRRGKVGGWRDEMSDAMHSLFWKHHGAAMRMAGYER